MVWESASKMKQPIFINLLYMSMKLSSLVGNHLLEIEQKGQNNFDVIIIAIQEKCHKMIGNIRIQFENTLNSLGQFSNREQFYQFMRHSSNYSIDFNLCLLNLKWKLSAYGFKKRVQYKIKLQSQELTEKQSLQCEVIVLKRKLAEYQKAEQKRKQVSRKKDKNHKLTHENSYQSQSVNGRQDLQREQQKCDLKQRKIRSNVDQVSKNFHQLKRKIIKKPLESRQRNHRSKSSSQEQPKQIISLPGDSSNEKKVDSQQQSNEEVGNAKQNQQKIEPRQQKQNQKANNNEKLILQNKSDSNQQGQDDYHYKQNNHQLVKSKRVEDQSLSQQQRKVLQEPRNSLSYKNDEDNSSDQEQGKFYKKLKIGNKTRIDFMNGDYYFGELKNNIFHGNGIYYSKVNGTYQGQWRNGKANGYGVTVDADGNRHEGFYKNDVRHGKGKDWYPNNERYEGDFCNSNKQGYGVYYYNNGDRYEGNWKKDMCQGFGKEVYANGSYYEGQWKEDEKHGDGILYSSFGEIHQTYSFGKLVSQANR